MRVLLSRTWFAPNGARFRRAPGGVEVPDDFAKFLPSDAVEVKDGEPAEKTIGGEPNTLSQLGSQINPPGDPTVEQQASIPPSDGDEETGGDDSPNLRDLTLAELRALASDRNVPNRGQMNKDELVAALS